LKTIGIYENKAFSCADIGVVHSSEPRSMTKTIVLSLKQVIMSLATQKQTDASNYHHHNLALIKIANLS